MGRFEELRNRMTPEQRARGEAKATLTKISEYFNKPYRRETRQNEDGTWFARIVEFPGCMTEGSTNAEALENLDDTMAAWLEIKIKDGDPIPEPKGEPPGLAT